MRVPHLTVDANSDVLCESEVRQMLRDICATVGMHSISEAYSVKGADYNPGVSGFIFIEFSNIAIHTFEGKGKTAINIDVFSCREFSKRAVIRYLRSKGVRNITANIIRRNIKL